VRGTRQRRNECRGDLTRVAAQRLRKLQRDVAGVIAVRRLLRLFDDDRAVDAGRDLVERRAKKTGSVRAQIGTIRQRHSCFGVERIREAGF
jgi:hypothetical protein